MRLSPDKSLVGVLEPVFAIRTEDDLGIGDTEGVRQMVDWCHRHRLNILQMLPINEIGEDNSPYNAISSLAIEPTTIAISPAHVPDMTPEQYHAIATPRVLAEVRRGGVNYPKVKVLKIALLNAAFESFVRNHVNRETSRGLEFRTFQTDNEAWLSDYALFRVLMEENGRQSTWDRWQLEHREPRQARTWLTSRPEELREQLMRKQLFFMYVQWIAFSQWEAIKQYAADRKVFLMGDIPFGVGRFSADTWANRSIFDLNWSGGAPPEKVFDWDVFTKKWGQNWGIPNYRWDELRRNNFEWWRTRVGNIQKVFHLYRIDHVLGLFRIYSFPWTPDRNGEFLPLSEEEAAAKTGGRSPGFKGFPDDTPEHKSFNQAQGEEILRVLQEASGDTTIVAEDLGVVPDYVPPTLEKLGIPGFRIPSLFREHDGHYSDPEQYPRLSLAQPATHDHAPLAAMWQEWWANIDAGKNVENNNRELRLFLEFAGLNAEAPPRQFTDEIHEAFTRKVMASNSWLVVFQITDVFGQTARFNTPGSTSDANWSYRLPQTVKELDGNSAMLAKAKMFSRLARENGREV